MNELSILYEKHKNKMIKCEELKKLMNGVSVFNNFSKFGKTKGIYISINKSQSDVCWSANQKLRYLSKKIDLTLSQDDINYFKQIGHYIIQPMNELNFFKHSEQEINFVLEDIVDNATNIENESYTLKTKTSGKSYHNRELIVNKLFFINEKIANIVFKIDVDIGNNNFPIAFHLQEDKLVLYIRDTQKTKTIFFTRLEFDKNDLDSIQNTIRDYYRKQIYTSCYEKEMKAFFSKDYEYIMFDPDHYELIKAYRI